MMTERPLGYKGPRQFYFSRGSNAETKYSYNLELFIFDLDRLIKKERPEEPFCPGSLLLLNYMAVNHTRLRVLMGIGNKLIKNGFEDHANREVVGEENSVPYWRNRLALDVVALPAYAVKNDKNYLVKNGVSLYRLFTRPSYLPHSDTNK